MVSRPDKRFGRYEVVAEIGRGAMGAVYKARDPKIERFVAVKAISAISQSSEEEQEYRMRFFHEAQAAGRLLHPGIVAIFDVGEEGEGRTPYIIMEYVAGQSLSGRLSGESSKLPLDTALRLTEEIAMALDCAHRQGVVHRDIKPANILLTDDGHAKIADFGIAKLNLSNVTMPGHAMGTPAYMSPEQVDGLAVDGRSDLFSLGVMLYNMVTGHRPFQGSSAVTVCYKVANANPLPASSFDLALPGELDAIIARALAKAPAQRFQSGAEFASEIRELRESLSGAAVPLPAKKIVEPSPAATAPNVHRARPKAQKFWSPQVLAVSYVAAAMAVFLMGTLVFFYGIPFHGSPREVRAAVPTVAVRPAPKRPEIIAADTVTKLAPAVVAEAAPAAVKISLPPAAKAKPLPRAHVAPPPLSVQPPAAPVAAPVELTRLRIEVQHHFAEGQLTVWVDEKLAYSTSLHGESKKRLAIFKDVQGADSAEVQIPTGQHTLRVNGQSPAHDFDESKTLTTNFVSGAEKLLRVDFEKNNHEMKLVLR